jgi:hypothetical protein
MDYVKLMVMESHNAKVGMEGFVGVEIEVACPWWLLPDALYNGPIIPHCNSE